MVEPRIARPKEEEEPWMLKPCPFCGADALIRGEHWGDICKWNILCPSEPPNCWISPQTGWLYTLEDAVLAWNKREGT